LIEVNIRRSAPAHNPLVEEGWCRQRGADARATLPNHADGKRDPRPIRQPERCPSSTSSLP
jgi:hypothetical protein